jgi:cytochrome P450
MFLGGTDTTSAALEWLIAELIKNPRIMKRAQKQVRRVVGKKSKIDINDIQQNGLLEMCPQRNSTTTSTTSSFGS